MATPSNLEEEDVANEDMLQQDELEEGTPSVVFLFCMDMPG